jgi:glycosyltransferase involved in cell wall biosynthesis
MTVLARLARGRDRSAPLAARPIPPGRPTVSVVIPARNEAERIGPCLDALAAETGLLEVIVVDDQSTDGTADVAERGGARLVRGRQPPLGWVGKPWALQQGLEAARGDGGRWRSLEDALEYAYRRPDDVAVVRRTRAERWYSEELFARFRPYGAEGAWEGRDPLSGATLPA